MNKWFVFLGALLVLFSVSFAVTYPYWVSDDNSSVWIKANATTDGNNSFYVYMNWSNGTLSNGDNVFIIFDDFNGPTLNLTKWEGNTSVFITQDGKLVQTSPGNALAINSTYWYSSDKRNHTFVIRMSTVSYGYGQFFISSNKRIEGEAVDFGRGIGFTNNIEYAWALTSCGFAFKIDSGVPTGNTNTVEVDYNTSEVRLYVDGVYKGNTSVCLTDNKNTIYIRSLYYDGKNETVDYVFVSKIKRVTPICENSTDGLWFVGGGLATSRRLCYINTTENLTEQQFELNYSLFNDKNLLITTDEGNETAFPTISIISPPNNSIFYDNQSLNFSFSISTADGMEKICWENLNGKIQYLTTLGPTQNSYSYLKDVPTDYSQTIQFICTINNTNYSSSINTFFVKMFFRDGCFNSNESGRYILTSDINVTQTGASMGSNIPACINISHANSVLDLNNKSIYLYPTGTASTYSAAIKLSANNITIQNGKIFIVRKQNYNRYGIGIFTYSAYSNLYFANVSFLDAHFSNKSYGKNGYGIYENTANTNERAEGLVFFDLLQDRYGSGSSSNYSVIYDCEVNTKTLTGMYQCLSINVSDKLEHEYFSGAFKYTDYNLTSFSSATVVSPTQTNLEVSSDAQNIYYSGYTSLVSLDTTFYDIISGQAEYPNGWKGEIYIPIRTEVLDFEVRTTADATHYKLGSFNVKNEKTNDAITITTGFTFFFVNDSEIFSNYNATASSFIITRKPIERDLSAFGILMPGYNTSQYAPRTDYFISKTLKNYTVYNETYTLFALENQYASSVLFCLYSNSEPLAAHFIVAKKFYANEGTAKRVATGLTNEQGKTYIILDVIQQLYNWEVYDFQGNLVYSTTVLEQIVPSASGCSVVIDITENKTQNLSAIGKYCECSMVGNITSQCTCRAFGNIDFKWNMSVYAENGTLLDNQISYISPTTFYNVYNETVFVYISNDEDLFQFVHIPQTYQRRFETNYFFVAISVLSILFGIMFQPAGYLFPIALAIVGLGNNLLDSSIAFMIIIFSVVGILVSIVSELRKVGWKM